MIDVVMQENMFELQEPSTTLRLFISPFARYTLTKIFFDVQNATKHHSRHSNGDKDL